MRNLWNDIELTSRDRRAFRIIICEIRDGQIIFEGLSDLFFLGEYRSLRARTSTGQVYPIELMPYPAVRKTDDELDQATYIDARCFRVSIPLQDPLQIAFFVEEQQGTEKRLWPKLGKFSRVVNGFHRSYFHEQNHIVCYENGMFQIGKYSKARHLRLELSYMKELTRKKHRDVVAIRALYYLSGLFRRKPVWLVSDRPYLAGDNGEHMFRFLQSTDAVKRNDICFVIQKDSPDFARIRSMGKVLAYRSLSHKIRYLRSTFILGSTYNELMTNLFGKKSMYYRDLRRFGFVFLRHGVSHNDMSRLLNRLRLNIRLLVATCRPEYEGILAGDYAYTEREVKLTGLPRFDNLYDERQKKIVILPTWRRHLQGEIDPDTLQRKYLPSFRESDYYQFYERLIHDERLLQAMEEHGYTGEFYLHPVFEKQAPDFRESRLISIGQGVADYQKVFREGGIMVTDYSSVAFDFAYLKKPVIYSQFDEDAFYEEHSYGKGYFTYREDGFGPVTTTVEQTVDALINYMEQDCQMERNYIDKVERFFAFTDRNNCRRLYEEIRRIEQARTR